MDFDNGITGVMLAGKQGLQFDAGHQPVQPVHRSGQFGFCILTFPGQLQVGLGLLPGVFQLFGLVDGGGDPGTALLGLPGPILIVPDLRVAQFLLDRIQATLLVLDIKGTSAAPGPCPAAP